MIEEIVRRGVKAGAKYGVSEIEVYAVRRVDTDIVGTVNGIERISTGQRISVGVRVSVGKKVTVQGGFVSKVEDVDSIVETAVKIARTLPDDPQWVSLPRKLGKTHVEGVLDPRIKNPELEQFLEIARHLLSRAKEIDRRAFTSTVSIGMATVERAIGNNYGEIQLDESTEFDTFINVKAVEGGEESGYYDSYVAPTLHRYDPEQLVARATEVAVKTLGAKRIETGTYELVLIPRVFAGVLQSLIVPAICADSVQKGRSPLKGKEGSQVLSEGITIVDDGTYPGLTGTKGFDDEGVPTKRKVVFGKGVLEGFLYDSYTASVEGKVSTGNAFRPTSFATPSPWISNVIVEPGKGELTDLVREVRRGIVVYSTIGEWLSNPVSGLLNATVTNAVYVENGEERFPVRGVVISGNIYELLKQPGLTLSGTLESFSRFMLPAIHIPQVTLAGK